MKKSILLLISISVLFLAFPAQAHDTDHSCPHDGATIIDLQNCVAHAADQGHIENQGVLSALQAQLNAAQSAVNRGQVHVAVNNLNAFISLTEAQAGKLISANHAEHMIHHAQRVIASLSS